MKKKFMKSKRNIALFLAMTMAITGIGSVGLRNNEEKAHASGTGTVYFAEGFGTGVDFDEGNNSWKINTNFDQKANASYVNDDGNQATIMENNHSEEGEPIIRLINGVQNANLNSGASDYRAGTAISTQKIQLNDDSQFSAKFTISMPDACVNEVQTGGSDYAREVGGDGIAFIITTEDDIEGQAGGGIGYLGVDNSIVVELDSYFNGAYCTFDTSSTAYVNWGYDNQIYADKDYNYLEEVADSDYKKYSGNNYGQYWNEVLNNHGYSQLSGSSVRRFDHVGVTVDGEPRKHLGISYLNSIKPDEVVGNKYVNLSDDSASTAVSTTATCATRFADEGDLSNDKEDVDNRLFTFWVEYDGTNLYVSYANGNFLTAERPSTPQISIKGNEALKGKFAGEKVNVGFTSAIGSSKANHTVHSIMFVNEYIEDGITNTSYTEKYYVESPNATADYITVGEKKYVLKDENEKVNIPLGSEATITDKSSTDSYKNYTLVDYSSNSLYPKETDCVNADGSTVLYQFYDLGETSSCSYTVKYYLEVSEADKDDTAVKVGEKWYNLKTDETLTKPAAEGTAVQTGTNTKGAGVLEGTTEVSDTFKSFEGYGYNPDATKSHGNSSGTVKEDDLVIELFYDKGVTTYKGEYYVELEDQSTSEYDKEIDGVKYKLNESYTSTDVALTSSATIIDKSTDSAYINYELQAETTEYPQYVSDIDDNGATVVYQIYKIRPTFVLNPSYKVQYYIEVPSMTPSTIEIDGKYYLIQSEETMTKYAAEGVKVSVTETPSGAGVKEANATVADTVKSFSGYTFNQTATDKNGKSSGAVTSDNSLVIMLMYDLDKVTTTTPSTSTDQTTSQTPGTSTDQTTTTNPSQPGTPTTSTQTSTSNTTVATGDSGNMFFFVTFLCSAGIVAVMLVERKRRAGKKR